MCQSVTNSRIYESAPAIDRFQAFASQPIESPYALRDPIFNHHDQFLAERARGRAERQYLVIGARDWDRRLVDVVRATGVSLNVCYFINRTSHFIFSVIGFFSSFFNFTFWFERYTFFEEL